MCFLAVTLLSVIAHLTAGQGWGGSNAGTASRWNGASNSQTANSGFGNVGWGTGAGAAGFGTGVGTHGFGVGGFGAQGFGVGGNGGFGLGRSGGLGWGGTNSFVNPLFNTTMTCTFSNTGITGSVTLRRQQNWGGWGSGLGSRSGLGGSLVVRTSTVSGTYNLVFTERARVEGTKSADNLGPVIGASQWGQSNGWGRGLGNQWRNPWSNAWGVGSSTTTQGIASTVTLSTNQETNVDLAAANLPFRDLERFAGRGVALCATLTTDTNGRTVCTDPVLACCKLGFDNQVAVTPAAP